MQKFILMAISLIFMSACTAQVKSNGNPNECITIVSQPEYNHYVDSISGTDYRLVYHLIDNTYDEEFDFIDGITHEYVYDCIWIYNFMFKPYAYSDTDLFVEWVWDYTPHYDEWYEVWGVDFNIYFHEPGYPLYVVMDNILFVPANPFDYNNQ